MLRYSGLFILRSAAAIGFLVAGCSLALDLDRAQCVSDLDCLERGPMFADSACIDGYCRYAQGSECEQDGGCSGTDSCVGDGCEVMGRACLVSADCDLGMSCMAGRCEGVVDPAWACLPDALVVDPGQSVSVRVPVVSVLDFSTPLPGISARLCSLLDADCSTPHAELDSGDNGLFEVELDSLFAGYLEITEDGYDPTLFFFPSIRWAESTPPPVLLAPNEVAREILSGVGAIADPERGHLFITVFNCLGVPAGGVRASASSADDQTVSYYVTEGLVEELTETVAGRGVAGFANLRVGTTAVTLWLAKTDQELAKVTLVVRAGFMSQGAFMVPGE